MQDVIFGSLLVSGIIIAIFIIVSLWHYNYDEAMSTTRIIRGVGVLNDDDGAAFGGGIITSKPIFDTTYTYFDGKERQSCDSCPSKYLCPKCPQMIEHMVDGSATAAVASALPSLVQCHNATKVAFDNTSMPLIPSDGPYPPLGPHFPPVNADYAFGVACPDWNDLPSRAIMNGARLSTVANAVACGDISCAVGNSTAISTRRAPISGDGNACNGISRGNAPLMALYESMWATKTNDAVWAGDSIATLTPSDMQSSSLGDVCEYIGNNGTTYKEACSY